MNDLPDTLQQLAARLSSLEQRVAALEQPSLNSAVLPSPRPVPAAAAPAAASQLLVQPVSFFSVFGKAMLGIAGAYVLRAVAETGALPQLAVAAVAIAYAVAWLIAAVRVKSAQWLPAAIYACTSAMILAPMLWELTLRFNVLSPAIAACVLAGFLLVATALAWRGNLAPVYWIANITVALASLALSIATHHLLPFLAAILFMAALAEIAAVLDHQVGLRLLVAAVADLAAWALVFIYNGPAGSRADYPALHTAQLLAPGCLLFLLYLVSVAVRTIPQHRVISVFETTQTLIAFLLAAVSLLYFAPLAGTSILAAACAVLSAAGYVALFFLYSRAAAPRTLGVFAAWSAGLLLAGCWLLLPAFWLAATLAAAAPLAIFLGVRLGRAALRIQGIAYLFAAAIAAAHPAYVFSILAGTLPAAPAPGIYLFTVCAILCYAFLQPSRPAHGVQRHFPVIPAALAASALAALAVQALAALGLAAEVHHLAFVRTLTLCILALALAFAGARWLRAELTWLAYAILAFVAAKLLFEDIHHGRLAFIAASIFVFAVTLIAVPRLARIASSGKDQIA